MNLKPKVKVLGTTGRFVYATHRERAEAMLVCGEATYESPTLIRLTATVRITAEMQDQRQSWMFRGERAKYQDSSHGDSGRAYVSMVRHSCHTPRETVVAKVPGLHHLGEITRRVL